MHKWSVRLMQVASQTCSREVELHIADPCLQDVEGASRHPGSQGHPLLPSQQLQPDLRAGDVQAHLQSAARVHCTHDWL